MREDCSRRLKSVLLTSASDSSFSAWATPVAADSGEKVTLATHQDRCLLREARMWNTPSVASSTGGQRNRGGDRQDELLLAGEALDLSTRLARMTSQGGSNTSPTDLTLNPQFVEALMVWPTGWSASECSETEFTLWKARMRSELLRIGLPPAAPPAQRDLFS